MQMILGGRRMGARSRTESAAIASGAGALPIQASTRARAAAPPLITESTSANPAARRPTIRPPRRTPGSGQPCRSNVTSCMELFFPLGVFFLLYHYRFGIYESDTGVVFAERPGGRRAGRHERHWPGHC